MAASSVRLPLVASPMNRGRTPDKDSRLVNAFVEKDAAGDVWVCKRPGLSVSFFPEIGVGGGLYNWKGQCISVIDGNVYKNSTLLGTVDIAYSSRYYFSTSLGLNEQVFLSNGSKAYTINSSFVLSPVADTNFPSHVPGTAYLDGTTYVLTADGYIRGSELNDPTTWDPLNVIAALSESDISVYLAVQLSFLVVMKETYTEFFYNAGSATGSPLLPVQGVRIDYGCAAATSVQRIGDKLYWLSTNRTGSTQVVCMEKLKVAVISTPPIERLLQTDGEKSYTNYASWQAHVDGHQFYGLTIEFSTPEINKALTLVYDITEGTWAQWTDKDGNYLPIIASSYGDYRQPYLQHKSSGEIFTLRVTNYSDFFGMPNVSEYTGSIPVHIYTPNYDGGTSNYKSLSVMRFVTDRYPGLSIDVRESDDDYQTWSPFRSVPLDCDQPQLGENGSFVRRAWHIRHNQHTPFRAKYLDLLVEVGSQ